MTQDSDKRHKMMAYMDGNMAEKPIPTRAAIEAYAKTDAAAEAVARAFCKRVGLDPDEPTSRIMPIFKNWEAAKGDASQAIAMHLAIREVLG